MDDVFAISPEIRYVATGHRQQVQMRSRPDLRNASSGDSDLYEELLVNPTLLALAIRRGNVDCGGLRYFVFGTVMSICMSSQPCGARGHRL